MGEQHGAKIDLGMIDRQLLTLKGERMVLGDEVRTIDAALSTLGKHAPRREVLRLRKHEVSQRLGILRGEYAALHIQRKALLRQIGARDDAPLDALVREALKQSRQTTAALSAILLRLRAADLATEDAEIDALLADDRRARGSFPEAGTLQPPPARRGRETA